jgi:hypothetical protein
MEGNMISVTEKSHADHLLPATLEWVLGCIAAGEADKRADFGNFRIYVVTLCAETAPQATVASALRGPETGEAPVSESDVHYGTRGGRPNVSRLTRLPSTQDNRVTVLISRESEEADWTLITAYGGPLAPQEPGDEFLAPENHAASVKFWSEHALSVDGSPEATVTEGHDFAAFSAAFVKPEPEPTT